MKSGQFCLDDKFFWTSDRNSGRGQFVAAETRGNFLIESCNWKKKRKNSSVIRMCVRVYMYVCVHKDISNLARWQRWKRMRRGLRKSRRVPARKPRVARQRSRCLRRATGRKCEQVVEYWTNFTSRSFTRATLRFIICRPRNPFSNFLNLQTSLYFLLYLIILLRVYQIIPPVCFRRIRRWSIDPRWQWRRAKGRERGGGERQIRTEVVPSENRVTDKR